MPQVLQDLINVLPVSAKIPSEVDVELQRKVASFFQSETTVNRQLPRFRTAAREMRERWLARRAAAATPAPAPAPAPTPNPYPLPPSRCSVSSRCSGCTSSATTARLDLPRSP